MRAGGRRTPEGAVVRQIRDGLAAHGVPVYRLNSGAVKTGDRFIRFSWVGAPDLVALLDGAVLFIECKSTGGRISEAQAAFRQACLDRDILHVVAYGWDDVRPFVEAA